MTVIYQILLALIFAVAVNECGVPEKLEPIGQYPTGVPEASGLHWDQKRGTLLVVSDRNGDIYVLDEKYEITRRLKTDTEDAEGVAMIGDTICVVDEVNDHIRFFNLLGRDLHEFDIAFENKDNQGFEGLDYAVGLSRMLTVNERNPCRLILIDGVKKTDVIPLTLPDASAVAFYEEAGEIWVLSDEKQSIIVLDLEYKFKHEYFLGIPKLEGLDINQVSGRFYVVSDQSGIVYEYAIPAASKK